MKLAEYKLNGSTYLFDMEDVPEGAELVTEDVTTKAVVLFADQVKPKKAAKAPENKAASAPATK